MSQLTVAALLAALAAVMVLRGPGEEIARLHPGRRRAVAGWLHRELGRRRRPPEMTHLRNELPAALEFLAVCLDAGQPVSGAVQTVARVSPPATQRLLSEVAAQLALGRAGPQAWEELRTHPVWGPAAADVIRSERSGISLTGVLRLHAEDARQEARDDALKAARTVGVRSVIPLMVCFLPAFILIGVVPIIAGLLGNFFGG